jgi:hypothetical protein
MIYLDLLVRKNYKKNWIDQIEEAVSIYTTSNIEECKLIICDSTTFKKYKKVNKKIIIISITDGIIIENDWSVDNVKYIICHTKIKDKTKSLNPLLSKLSEIYSEKKENEVLDNFE